jgi:hypothetical protein
MEFIANFDGSGWEIYECGKSGLDYFDIRYFRSKSEFPFLLNDPAISSFLSQYSLWFKSLFHPISLLFKQAIGSVIGGLILGALGAAGDSFLLPGAGTVAGGVIGGVIGSYIGEIIADKIYSFFD